LRALLSHLRARVVVGSSAKRINGKYWKKRLLPGARFAEVARRYGIAERVLFRWKQKLTVTAPAFVSVEIGAIEIDRRRRFWSVPTPLIARICIFKLLKSFTYLLRRFEHRRRLWK
jgi:hypothetical protein